jgi:hypothetical protein
MPQDNVVLTSMTCKQYFSNILTGISCSWKQQLIDALCTAYNIPTDLTCEQVHNCETLTVLSDFTIVDNTISIQYTDEGGTTFTRSFDLDDTTVVITADNGLTKNTDNNVQLGGTLIHNTVNNTNSFIHTFEGATVYEYPYQFMQLQNFDNGTGIVSFKSGGAQKSGQPDFGNTVRLGINYTGKVYDVLAPDPDLNGYMNDRIGYWIGVNGTGNGSFGIRTDNDNSKTSALLFHTLDTSVTDAFTFYAKHPTTADGDIAIAMGGVGFEPYRISTFHDDGRMTLWKYGLGNFVTPAAYFFLGTDNTGKVVEISYDEVAGLVEANDGLSKPVGDLYTINLGSNAPGGAPITEDRYIGGAHNLSIDVGTFTVGTTAPISSRITSKSTSTSDFWSIIGIKQQAVGAVGGIGVEGQFVITGGTTYTGQDPLGGLYGELAFLGSGSWTFGGGFPYVQLAGLSGVVTIYTDDASNYTSGLSLFAGGQYFINAAGSGTIDKFAALRCLYPVETPGLSFSGTLTTAYGLYIDDYTGSSMIARITNRYGVYQAGAGETNVFAGKTDFTSLINLAVFTNSSPTDGDIWRADNTNTGLKVRINGFTKTITVT